MAHLFLIHIHFMPTQLMPLFNDKKKVLNGNFGLVGLLGFMAHQSEE